MKTAWLRVLNASVNLCRPTFRNTEYNFVPNLFIARRLSSCQSTPVCSANLRERLNPLNHAFSSHNRCVSILGRSSKRTPSAFQSSVPLAEYVRDMVHDHILERGGAFRERGGVFRAFINAGKAWAIGYHECVVLSAGELEHADSAKKLISETSMSREPKEFFISSTTLREA